MEAPEDSEEKCSDDLMKLCMNDDHSRTAVIIVLWVPRDVEDRHRYRLYLYTDI